MPAVVGCQFRVALGLQSCAIVHALRDCGLVLPDGSRYRPSRISYVGYSLGAMVGVVARGVEERATALSRALQAVERTALSDSLAAALDAGRR